MHDDLLQIRSLGVNFYVLRDSKGLYLIDGGFIRGTTYLRRALRKKGWDREPILGIIVTHGHLDHILNIQKIAEMSGAWVAAPRLDLPHYDGRPSYQGVARVTGCLEAIGRPLLRFGSFTPTRLLDDGELIDVWHGLKVVHLPGHTEGHSGFYCSHLKLLFSADLFASFGNRATLPPRIFNSNGSQIPKSIAKALALDLDGILPNHSDNSTAEIHLERLIALENRDRGE